MAYPHEGELRWYLDGSREADFGARSQHASFVARMENGSGGTMEAQDAADDRRLEAAERARPIFEALSRCSHRSQQVLAAFYRPDLHSDYWGDLTHVLLLTGKYSRKTHGPTNGGLGLRMSNGVATPEQRDQAAFIRRAAEVLVARAHAEYEKLAVDAPARHKFGTKHPSRRASKR